jgi:hypothetical protein
LFGWWTGHGLQLPVPLLVCFLLPIPFNALWFTSSVVHAAGNRHEGLAARYLIATSMSLLACAALAYFVGLPGAAVSTLVIDLLLIPYVVNGSLKMTDDSFHAFLPGMLVELKNLPHHFRLGRFA